MANNDNDTSPHILNTSSQLLGLCFIVLTALQIQKLSDASFIDEITSAASILFMISCILSFLSMRSVKRAEKYERIADFFFLFGLIVLFLMIMMLSFSLIK